MPASLGTLPIDLAKLLETRLLVQANSGGGKSHALRRILEQTAAKVQQIVIDPEGEFASLRERFDYIICAPRDADAVANPHTAAALARAIWESGTSAIVDIYELKAHERTLFVRRFLEALINAPKSIWHPAMVVIDEVHMFAPQTGQSESTGAVIDLATRGRKRGLALVGATQRLSKLHKDVAAELLNKLVGRTGLDVDVQRAADELGMTRGDAQKILRDLDPGEFFAFGPALTRTVERTRVGAVQTTHPKTGARGMIAPPPPSKAVLAKLQKLEGIQREAEAEVRTLAELAKELTDTRRKLTIAEKRTGDGVPEAEVARRVRDAVAAMPRGASISKAMLAGIKNIAAGLQALQAEVTGVSVDIVPRARPARQEVSQRTHAAPASVDGLRAGAVRILQELAARHPAGYSRPQVGTLTQFAHKGGTFTTYISDLRRGGFVEERAGLMYATEAGIQALGDKVPAAPTSHDEAMQLWRKALRSGAFAMLEAIVAAGAPGTTRQEVADAVGMTAAGGTFTTYLGDLRRNGLITDRDKRCTANDILYPKGGQT
ncbi:MAG: ATP-binding protein [Variovorax sp.]